MNAAMAAPGAVPEGDTLNTLTTVPAAYDPDTRTASSEVAPGPAPPRPVPHAAAPLPDETETLETSDHTGAFPELPRVPSRHPLPNLRNGRSLSLAQIAGPVKRKPLSSTASPAAVRFSKGAAYADLLADLPRPEQRFARSCSLDSPTLYEFPDHRSLLATTSSLNAIDWPASPDASEPYVLALTRCGLWAGEFPLGRLNWWQRRC